MLRQSGTNTYVSILDWEAGNPLPETETQNWCGGDGRMLSFDVDGTVLPCMRYSSIAISGQPTYRIGDVDSGIAAVEVNPLWEKLQDERESGPPARQKSSVRKRSSKRKNQPDR